VSNFARARVASAGPFEHTSSLKMIESTFGLQPLTARDAHAMDLRQVLRHGRRRPVPAGAIPTSSQVPGPDSDAAAFCSAASVQSVSPPPVSKGKQHAAAHAAVQPADRPGLGMGALARQYTKNTAK